MAVPFFHKEKTTIRVDKTAAAKFGKDRYSDDRTVAWSSRDCTSMLSRDSGENDHGRVMIATGDQSTDENSGVSERSHRWCMVSDDRRL